MLKQLIVSLAILCALGTGSCEDRLKDVFDKPVGNYTREVNGYKCRVLNGAWKMGTSFEKSLQRACSQNTWYRDMRVGGNRRFLPEIVNGDLNLTKEEILEVVKPLGATGSICCAANCPGNSLQMKAEMQRYWAKIQCTRDADVQSAVVNFTGDKFTCHCENEKGNKLSVHRRTRASCPLPEGETENHCCTYWQRVTKRCPRTPDWAKYAFPDVTLFDIEQHKA